MLDTCACVVMCVCTCALDVNIKLAASVAAFFVVLLCVCISYIQLPKATKSPCIVRQTVSLDPDNWKSLSTVQFKSTVSEKRNHSISSGSQTANHNRFFGPFSWQRFQTGNHTIATHCFCRNCSKHLFFLFCATDRSMPRLLALQS